MKVCHWSFMNRSGLATLTSDLSKAENAIGIESFVVHRLNPKRPEGLDAGIHVIHRHIPDVIKIQAKKFVYVIHGTPEHCFQTAVESGLHQSYGASDPWMMAMHYLKVSDAIVVFQERHRFLWQSMCDKKTVIKCIPMGVDKSFWASTPSKGKFAGSPSVLTAENCHYIKWPLDLFFIWPFVVNFFPNAVLHSLYLPHDQHKWFFPLVNSNGTAYKSFFSAGAWSPVDLRNAFCSTDFYIGLVRYGDYNRVCLEAKASGAKVISYAGNSYADYWIPEGDQRNMILALKSILGGEVEPRLTSAVADIMETAAHMKGIYENL